MFVRSSYSIYTIFLHFPHCKTFDTLTDLLCWADNDWHNFRLRRAFCCIFGSLTYCKRTKMHPLLQRWYSFLSVALLTIKTPVVSSEEAWYRGYDIRVVIVKVQMNLPFSLGPFKDNGIEMFRESDNELVIVDDLQELRDLWKAKETLWNISLLM